MLIGISFFVNVNWYFEGWLKQESGLDILNFVDEGQGLFVLMCVFLVDVDVIVEMIVGVVIWEIFEWYVILDDQQFDVGQDWFVLYVF